MTAPQPATPGSDSVRAQITEVQAKLLECDDTTLSDLAWRASTTRSRANLARAAAYRTNPSSEESDRG